MSTQFLFTYGTLKSTQPEHAIHCVPPISIQTAKVQASLWRLQEGYPIIEIEPELSLLDATDDCAKDWETAKQLAKSAASPPTDGKWIHGELFSYPLRQDILNKMDEWENFRPGIRSTYQRRIIWVKDENDQDRFAWAYVCFSPPNWATLLGQDRWNEST